MPVIKMHGGKYTLLRTKNFVYAYKGHKMINCYSVSVYPDIHALFKRALRLESYLNPKPKEKNNDGEEERQSTDNQDHL